MMPSTPRRDSRRVLRSGFTLTEMLVVIGIIVLVLSIATPMVTRAWRMGDRTRTAADIQAIANALEAYRTDHGNYPQIDKAPAPSLANFNGARMLCRALIAPGKGEPQGAANTIWDGAGSKPAGTTDPNAKETEPGPGFRIRGTSGKVYGPYLKPETFKLGDPDNNGSSTGAPGAWAILDRYNRPYVYYVAVGKPNIRLAKSYAWDRSTSDKPMYNALDNWDGTTGAMPRETLARMLGDTIADGKIDDAAVPPEIPAYDGPFIVWSAGPDEVFGPPPGMPVGNPTEIRKAVEKSDDVTNFRN